MYISRYFLDFAFSIYVFVLQQIFKAGADLGQQVVSNMNRDFY